MASVHAIRPDVVDPRAEFLVVRDELRKRNEDRDLIELWADMQPAERTLVLRSAAQTLAATRPVNEQYLVPLRPLRDTPAHLRTPDRIASDLRLCPIEWMPAETRAAIRSAIHRMSAYASRLRDGMRSASHPSQALAASARQALAQGDADAAMHFLKLIEQNAE